MSNNLSHIKSQPSTIYSYIFEFLFIIVFFLQLIVVLSVYTFNPNDKSTFSYTNSIHQPIQNLFGNVGAQIAEWGYQLCGIGSGTIASIILLNIIEVAYFRQYKQRLFIKLAGYPQLFLCFLGLISTINNDWNVSDQTFYSGGIIGYNISILVVNLLGKYGSILLFIFGIIATLPLCLGLKPLYLISKILNNSLFTRQNKILQNMLSNDENKEHPTIQNNIYSKENEQLKHSNAQNTNIAPNFPITKKTLIPNNAIEYQSQFNNLIQLLNVAKPKVFSEEHAESLKSEALILEEKLSTFGVLGKVLFSQTGPVVNVHEFEPSAGIKVSKVLSLQEDLALALKAQSILMAPQPGKSTIGIEIPNSHREAVLLRQILESADFFNAQFQLPVAFGLLVNGKTLVADLAGMPHLLVAGSTGSGKSVGINIIILSLIMRYSPKEVRLILVDPKMLELTAYEGIGHLLMPVVTDPKKAAGALKWAIKEMDRRYSLMKNFQVRNIYSYNTLIEAKQAEHQTDDTSSINYEKLPYIVIVIDELCDLMMTAPKDVEDSIQRLAQKARAAGIHLVLATQRPSVDVLTGVIKANLPCRISFQVASRHDSRTIIETIGAEKLLGKGDMLFLPPGTSKIVRAQCAYVGDTETINVVNKIKEFYSADFNNEIIDDIERETQEILTSKTEQCDSEFEKMDEESLYEKSVTYAIETGTVSTSSLQRQFRIGYNRAGRIMDRMVKEKLVGPAEIAGKPRQVLVSAAKV